VCVETLGLHIRFRRREKERGVWDCVRVSKTWNGSVSMTFDPKEGARERKGGGERGRETENAGERARESERVRQRSWEDGDGGGGGLKRDREREDKPFLQGDTTKLIERNPPSRGVFLFTMFPHQEPCVRGPPLKDLYQVLRGGSSYSRFLMREHNTQENPPGGGGFFRSKCQQREGQDSE